MAVTPYALYPHFNSFPLPPLLLLYLLFYEYQNVKLRKIQAESES